LRQTPNLLTNPKVPVGRRSGAAFLLVSFLWPYKESNRRRAAPGTQSTMRKAHSNQSGSLRRFPDPHPESASGVLPPSREGPAVQLLQAIRLHNALALAERQGERSTNERATNERGVSSNIPNNFLEC